MFNATIHWIGSDKNAGVRNKWMRLRKKLLLALNSKLPPISVEWSERIPNEMLVCGRHLAPVVLSARLDWNCQKLLSYSVDSAILIQRPLWWHVASACFFVLTFYLPLVIVVKSRYGKISCFVYALPMQLQLLQNCPRTLSFVFVWHVWS